MKTLCKLFFETKMTWKRVLVFAGLTAVLTAAILLIPGLNETSARYLGATQEAWFLFALYIIMNCEKPLEAAMKTFVFFLVSQPLIYLIQVPFSELGWGIFRYYPFWLKFTVLTLPGAGIAWFVKKDNAISALILSVATGFAGIVLLESGVTVAEAFPGELIRALFCLAEILLFLFVLLKKRGNRIICAVITAAIILAYGYFQLGMGRKTCQMLYPLPAGHTWEVQAARGRIGEVEVADGALEITADQYSEETVTVTNELGESIELVITYGPKSGLEITEQ